MTTNPNAVDNNIIDEATGGQLAMSGAGQSQLGTVTVIEQKMANLVVNTEQDVSEGADASAVVNMMKVPEPGAHQAVPDQPNYSITPVHAHMTPQTGLQAAYVDTSQPQAADLYIDPHMPVDYSREPTYMTPLHQASYHTVYTPMGVGNAGHGPVITPIHNQYQPQYTPYADTNIQAHTPSYAPQQTPVQPSEQTPQMLTPYASTGQQFAYDTQLTTPQQQPLERQEYAPVPPTPLASDPAGAAGVLGEAENQLELLDVVRQDLVAELATDQNGSRFIQQRLETATDQVKQAVFEQICGANTIRLCTDVFGNYVIQKFFEHGLPTHVEQLVSDMRNRILPLSLQMYGCRVVQAALQYAGSEEIQLRVIAELDGHVMQCIKDQNGNHVIQKCIECVPMKHNQFILDAFQGRITTLSSHPFGCRVIQRLLENCDDIQKSTLVEEILTVFEDLSQNQYGNYVVQHILENGMAKHKNAAMRKLQGNLLAMSKHKFASNVVEKAFITSTPETRRIFTEEILGSDQSCPIAEMAKDQYGNYVVQRILDTADQALRMLVVSRIEETVPNIRKIAYGKHICNKIQKLTGRVI